MSKLFAVVLGGSAPKSNTELHDVVFVVGETIEATYEQLMDQWFGDVRGLHVDSWVELDIVDGYKIRLSETPAADDKKLYFINLGAYRDGEFGEIHSSVFLVADNQQEAKSRAKAGMRGNGVKEVHKDYLHEVDDCIALQTAGGRYITLEATGEAENLRPVNAYRIIPGPVITKYLRAKKLPAG